MKRANTEGFYYIIIIYEVPAKSKRKGDDMANLNTQFKTLNDCAFAQVVQLWNDGFQGYYQNMNRTPEAFLSQLGRQHIHPQLSLIAFVDDQPAGFILTAIKDIDDRKLAWNGGTGIVPQFRGAGLGRLMMQKWLEMLEQQKISSVQLEVVAENEKAVALYQSAGFEKVCQVKTYYREGSFDKVPFQRNESKLQYQIVHSRPVDAERLPFYRKLAAWPSQYFNIRDGEAIKVYNDHAEWVGYAVYKRKYDNHGQTSLTSLLHCEARPGWKDASNMIKLMLSYVYAPHDLAFIRKADNLPIQNKTVCSALENEGFRVRNRQELMYVKF